MAEENVPASVQLTFDFVNYNPTLAKLKEFTNATKTAMNGIGTAANQAKNVTAMALGAIVGGLGKVVQDFTRTVGSAIMRTLAYGLINAAIKPLQDLSGAINDAKDASLLLGRATAALSVDNTKTKSVYGGLVGLITDSKNASYLLAKDLAGVSFTLALAGASGEKFNQVLSIVDKLAAVTGGDAKSLSMDFLRLSNMFEISTTDMKAAADILVRGAATSIMEISDLLNASKMLGPSWVMAYGPGIDSMKEFTTTVAAMTDVGYKGGQAGTYLNRFILGLLAPTQTTSAAIRAMGINVYDATGASMNYAEALDRLALDSGKLRLEQDKLTSQQATMVAHGEDTKDIDKQIADLETQITTKTKSMEKAYTEFVHSGGSLRPINDILEDFASTLEKGGENSLQFFQLLKKVFELRGMRAGALIANIREYEDQRKQMGKTENALEKMTKGYDESWAAIVQKTSASVSKLQMLFTEMFAAPIMGELAKGVKENIIDPFTNELLKEDRWARVREGMTKVFGPLFQGFTRDLGDLFTLAFMPDVKGFKAGTKEYEDALTEAAGKVLERFQPIVAAFGELFAQIGQLAGANFADAFWDATWKGFTGMGSKRGKISQLGAEMANKEFSKAPLWANLIPGMSEAKNTEILQKQVELQKQIDIAKRGGKVAAEFQEPVNKYMQWEKEAGYAPKVENLGTSLMESIRNSMVSAISPIAQEVEKPAAPKQGWEWLHPLTQEQAKQFTEGVTWAPAPTKTPTIEKSISGVKETMDNYSRMSQIMLELVENGLEASKETVNKFLEVQAKTKQSDQDIINNLKANRR